MELGFDARTAFTVAMRVFRGGGYTKDQVYLRGLASLLDYLGEGGDLDKLLIGKVSLEFIPLIEELRWRRVLKPPCLLPRYFDLPVANERLARLRRKPAVATLCTEVC